MKKKKVDVYRRLLKYPPFAVSREAGAMKIVHKLKNGKEIIATALEYVTSADAEKLYALCYIAQKNKSYNIIHTEKLGRMAEITAFLWDIRKLTNCNDDNYIFQAIDRITGIKINYNFFKKMTITHIVHKAKFNPETGKINILMDWNMFRNFSKKALTINIENYANLSPAGKNLYGYIASNSACDLTEKLLIERTVIRSARYCESQRTLKRALLELKEKHIIKNFEIEKKSGERHIIIDRLR